MMKSMLFISSLLLDNDASDYCTYVDSEQVVKYIVFVPPRYVILDRDSHYLDVINCMFEMYELISRFFSVYLLCNFVHIYVAVFVGGFQSIDSSIIYHQLGGTHCFGDISTIRNQLSILKISYFC